MFLSFIADGFNFIIDNTFGWIFKGLFFLLEKILPAKFVLVITEYQEMFWQGIKTTMFIALVGTIIGFIIAVILGTLRCMKVKEKDTKFVRGLKHVVQSLIKTYVTIFRGTPMIVQAMIIYYGLVTFLKWEPFTAGLFTVTINTGAYLTEVIKDGILSIDKGQTEAARSLGFSHFKTMLFIVFPQAIKNCMSSIGNEIVINIKDTSVLNVIGCGEMYMVLRFSSAKDNNYMETMIVGALIYLILTYSTTKLLHFIEKKLDVPVVDFKSSN